MRNKCAALIKAVQSAGCWKSGSGSVVGGKADRIDSMGHGHPLYLFSNELKPVWHTRVEIERTGAGGEEDIGTN